MSPADSLSTAESESSTKSDGAVPVAPGEPFDSPVKGLSDAEQDQWSKLQKRVKRTAERVSAADVFGDAAATGGAVYRWGLTTALQAHGDLPATYPPLAVALTRLAADENIGRKLADRVDLSLAAEFFCDQQVGTDARLYDATLTVAWAAAMPKLAERLSTRIWWDLLGKLQQIAEQQRGWDRPESPQRLILGGELGLTLSWRLRDLPSCARLQTASVKVVKEWFAAEADAIAAAVTGIHDSRVVLASVLRCNRLFGATAKAKFSKRQRAIAADLATWVAGFANPGGGGALDDPVILAADAKTFHDDSGKAKRKTKAGLFGEAMSMDPETLTPAIQAALGKTQTGGRLAWQVSLPESFIHCDDAKVAVMMPEWDVRRGRTVIDYGASDCRIEVYAGRHKAISGTWQVMITTDGDEQFADGEWESICEYTDDDVHYLELEQAWSGGWSVQRHLMVLREDRCVLLADSVVPGVDADVGSAPQIAYTGRWSLDDSVRCQGESETREIWLTTKPGPVKKVKKQRKEKTPSYTGDVMAIPLSASEWRIGPSGADLTASDDHKLVIVAKAKGRLFAPLWLDLIPRRLKRKRTWRSLTIADELQIVPDEQAVAYRLQTGSEQWVVYRSLEGSRVRSVLGKHLVADFFAGRFHPEDGDIEELVTVEGHQDE